MWSRHVFRYSDLDFEANQREGVGIDWPIRYADISPWYEHVERFIGASGENSGLPQLPEQILQPPFEMNALEKHIRGALRQGVHRSQAHLQRDRGAVARAQWPRALPGPQSMRARLSVQRVFLVERRDAARRGGHRQPHAAAGLRGAFADLRRSKNRVTGVRVVDVQYAQDHRIFRARRVPVRLDDEFHRHPAEHAPRAIPQWPGQ